MKPYNDIELLQLKIKYGGRFHYELAQDKRCPVNILKNLSRSILWDIRYEVSKNPSTPSMVLRELLSYDDFKIRQAIAKHPNNEIKIPKCLLE